MIIAHRANDIDNLKENSKEAILSALNKDYIDGVEFDVRMTKDNDFVLYHNAIYKDYLIKNSISSDLDLCTLNNLLKDIKSNKLILIDIKCEDGKYKDTADNLIKIIKKYDKLNIYLCSFNYELCKYLKEKSNYKVGLLISKVINKNKNVSIFDFISIKYTEYKKEDKLTFVWTINNIKTAQKFLKENVNIITDKAYLFKNY